MTEDEVQRTSWFATLAAVRKSLARYLNRKSEAAIDERYRTGYAGEGGLGPEFEGWEQQGVWPDA
jgi:hypothetical protein